MPGFIFPGLFHSALYMFFLLASIFSSTVIFIIFKIAENYSVKLTPLITVNYLAASVLGLVFLMKLNLRPFFYENNWFIFGISLGILFILMFYLIGTSTQKAGITVTTLASKMSLVFPVFFSLYWFNETVSLVKYIGLFTALLAVLFTIYKKDIRKTTRLSFFLPLIIFVGGGFIDALIKLIQADYIHDWQVSAFTTSVFITAFISGLTAIMITRKTLIFHLDVGTITLGIILGLTNFGSLYFFINALNKSTLDSSLVFTLNNMFIVIFSALAGRLIFKEHLNRINLLGFILAFVSLIILI